MKKKIDKVLKSISGDPDAYSIVSKVPNVDYQYNGAFKLAAKAGMEKFQYALQIAGKITNCSLLISGDATERGFVNIRVQNGMLEELDVKPTATMIGRYLIDFGGPNIAKPLHVGHLRSLVIGDSLTRILKACGAQVITDVHFGDWGLQMGQIISEIQISGNMPVSADELEGLYTRAVINYREMEERADIARMVTKRLQAGMEPELSIWKKIREISITDQLEVFDELGIKFDMYFGESDSEKFYNATYHRFSEQGLIEKSDGALTIDVNSEGKSELPPLIFKKTDGSSLYATTDLMTLEARQSMADKVIYVADARQQLHFEQIFRAANKAGMSFKTLDHVAFGTVKSPNDGKAFKTRSGGTVHLRNLIDEAAKVYEKKQKDKDPVLAREMAINAIKFWDLSQPIKNGYVYDPEDMLASTGFTAPYVLYSVVRAKHILDKAEDPAVRSYTFKVRTNPERNLAFLLNCVPDTVEKAADELEPYHITQLVFELAKEWSRLYAGENIVTEPRDEVRHSRLKLVATYHDTMVYLLDLLGLTIPEKM